jgi:hypothetical protein
VFANFGIAIAARIPMITTTIRSSISVKTLRMVLRMRVSLQMPEGFRLRLRDATALFTDSGEGNARTKLLGSSFILLRQQVARTVRSISSRTSGSVLRALLQSATATAVSPSGQTASKCEIGIFNHRYAARTDQRTR